MSRTEANAISKSLSNQGVLLVKGLLDYVVQRKTKILFVHSKKQESSVQSSVCWIISQHKVFMLDKTLPIFTHTNIRQRVGGFSRLKLTLLKSCGMKMYPN